MEIKQTTDYNKFKIVHGNRELLERHVNKLVDSILERNLLAANPILVNDKMEVIDGQHRLEASKRIGLPIHYTVVDRSSLREVQLLNTAVRNWTLTDFLNSYVAMGLEKYKELEKFVNDTGIGLSNALYLIVSRGSDNIIINMSSPSRIKEFKKGELTFTKEDMERAHKIAKALNKIEAYSDPNLIRDREFIVAVARVDSDELTDILVEKLQETNEPIHRAVNTRSYLYQMEQALNYRIHEKNRIRLY